MNPKSDGTTHRTDRPSGLFRRTYFTFVVTVLAAAIVAGMGAWWVAQVKSESWIGATVEMLSEENDALIRLMDDHGALEERTKSLGQQLHARVAVYDIDGRKLAGRGPDRAPKQARKLLRRLQRGRPFVKRPNNRRDGSTVVFPLAEPVYGELVAVVHVRGAPARPLVPLVVVTGLVMLLLGVGAWALSRSLIVRLANLERSAERIANGDLDHRVGMPSNSPVDEIDELGVAFNEMADKVQTLVRGQQTLLANVSHELRTPIARIKVLVELLEDRVDMMSGHVADDGRKHLDRVRSGLGDMNVDTQEIEKLIADLLTSGRLELRVGDRAGLETGPVTLAHLAQRMGKRVDAQVRAPDDVVIEADEMLLERLLSNLLANARRACPDGTLTIDVTRRGNQVEIAVEDEGPGVAAADRERIFEPFRRLDAARSRDKGGVGLGLYLCRQIARAHGGDIVAADRADGRSGARMVVTLDAA